MIEYSTRETMIAATRQQINRAQHNIFKAEVFQEYFGVDRATPSFAAWMDGDKHASRLLMEEDEGYKAWVAERRSQGIVINRVHVVEEPFPPYLEWEIEIGYKYLIRHGIERIYLAAKARLQDVPLPDGDTWIIDNQTVAKLDYGGEPPVCVGGTIYEPGDDIANFLYAKHELMRVAEPVEL